MVATMLCGTHLWLGDDNEIVTQRVLHYQQGLLDGNCWVLWCTYTVQPSGQKLKGKTRGLFLWSVQMSESSSDVDGVESTLTDSLAPIPLKASYK